MVPGSFSKLESTSCLTLNFSAYLHSCGCAERLPQGSQAPDFIRKEMLSSFCASGTILGSAVENAAHVGVNSGTYPRPAPPPKQPPRLSLPRARGLSAIVEFVDP
jgi:hypothetical protein